MIIDVENPLSLLIIYLKNNYYIKLHDARSDSDNNEYISTHV